MAYTTADGVEFLSYGELHTLTSTMKGDEPAAGLARIYAGERLTRAQVFGSLTAARFSASAAGKRIIERATARLGYA